MNKSPSVAIIIVNWNGLQTTDECLESLQHITYPNYKIILVDNASTDGSVDFFKQKYADIKIIALDKNTGFTGGSNAAMEWALEEDYEYVLLLNNDTVIEDVDFLAKMTAAMEENTEAGLACPTILYHDTPGRVWYAGGKISLWSGWKHNYRIPGSQDKFYTTGYVTGCCLLARSETIRDIGLLNNAYFLTVEDVEWSVRAENKGWSLIYIPKATVLHKDSISSESEGKGKYSPLRIYYEWRNSFWFVREYANLPQKSVIFPFHFGGIILFKAIAYMLLGRRKKLTALLKALKDGLTIEAYKFENGG